MVGRGFRGVAATAVLAGAVLHAGGCAPAERLDAVPLADGRIAQMPELTATETGPLLPAPGTDAAPETGLGRLGDASVAARILVITADGTNASLGAIRTTLDYLGTPYDVLNASTGPTLTADMLASGASGRYQAIFLDTGDLPTRGGSAFTADEWMTLAAYEAQFGVRRVALYAAPSASYGLTGVTGVNPAGSPNGPNRPILTRCTRVGASIFIGTNCAQPVTIGSGFAYPAQAADGATVPLLVDDDGKIYGAIRRYTDGREALALTFAQSSRAPHTLQLAYGLVSWATRGLFVGERRVYASPQIDDLFLTSAIYTGGTYRITDADLQAIADWQAARRATAVTSGFRLAWALNAYGSASRAGDPLTSKAHALGATFAWLNHTWDHASLDSLGYTEALGQLTQNNGYVKNLGLIPYATVNAVTPNISGLRNPDAMQALFDAGIRQVVSDTSDKTRAPASPNSGQPNPLVPGVLEIPRLPNELYYNVSRPEEWVAEFEALRGQRASYVDLIALVSDGLVAQLLRGNNAPWMFHQANARDVGGGHSLLSDVMDATFDKYAALATLPIVSPTMEELAERVRRRMAFDVSGVNVTIGPGANLTAQVTNAATVTITGLCTPAAEMYAGQTISYLELAAGASVTLSTAGCVPAGNGVGAVGVVGGAGLGDGAGAGAGAGERKGGGAHPPSSDAEGGAGSGCRMAGPGTGARLFWVVAMICLFIPRRRRRPGGRPPGPTGRGCAGPGEMCSSHPA